jgi:hypothetical protein
MTFIATRGLSCFSSVPPLSRKILTFGAGIIRRHRAAIGSCRRKLSAGQQALLVLAYLRKGETFAELADLNESESSIQELTVREGRPGRARSPGAFGNAGGALVTAVVDRDLDCVAAGHTALPGWSVTVALHAGYGWPNVRESGRGCRDHASLWKRTTRQQPLVPR